MEVHMSSTQAQTAKLLRHAPYFPVANVEKSMAYYEEVLGFRCEYSAGDPLQFAICSRDGFAIMLRRVADADLIVPIEKQGGTWDAFIWVNDAEALHSEFKSRGADVVYGPLIQESYQMNEFAIRDCDGHVLGVGAALNK
jgi:predicted enzyme related to lactoylglutathione lyase